MEPEGPQLETKKTEPLNLAGVDEEIERMQLTSCRAHLLGKHELRVNGKLHFIHRQPECDDFQYSIES